MTVSWKRKRGDKIGLAPSAPHRWVAIGYAGRVVLGGRSSFWDKVYWRAFCTTCCRSENCCCCSGGHRFELTTKSRSRHILLQRPRWWQWKKYDWHKFRWENENVTLKTTCLFTAWWSQNYNLFGDVARWSRRAVTFSCPFQRIETFLPDLRKDGPFWTTN